jgi:hypothetical protein
LDLGQTLLGLGEPVEQLDRGDGEPGQHQGGPHADQDPGPARPAPATACSPPLPRRSSFVIICLARVHRHLFLIVKG